MKNKHLSKAVQRQGFYEFRRQIEYECGNVIDKDYQGALNLKKYGEMFLKQQSVA
jgi:putative transposase